MKAFLTWIESTGTWAPWCFLALFVAASFLMIWRLEAMTESGFEGTVLGTLVMPYCSGMGNLIFAFVLGAKGGPGEEVVMNSLVNNVTNMTLLIGLPTIFWGMNVLPAGKSKKQKSNPKEHQINRLSLLLTLTAVLFFTGAVWALARKGKLDSGDGLVLVGLFLFWQCFHLFDVLKSNVRQNKSFSWMLPLDLAVLAIGAYGIYLSTDWLVKWVSSNPSGFVGHHLGWLSGWLMVLPNGLLAFYYAWRGNPEVVYSSQVGDGHISIPLCLGIYALYHPMQVPPFFQTGVVILLGAAVLHFLFVAIFGRLPRFMGWVLIGAYAVFLYKGLGK
ncbi:MAG: sodium:calcium symporter [Verrucomicrobia bacterium]|nr:sodium:calcium symporter [Verrucomicrobiota bacterium]